MNKQIRLIDILPVLVTPSTDITNNQIALSTWL